MLNNIESLNRNRWTDEITTIWDSVVCDGDLNLACQYEENILGGKIKLILSIKSLYL